MKRKQRSSQPEKKAVAFENLDNRIDHPGRPSPAGQLCGPSPRGRDHGE
jgi:hypothetical protein